MQYQLIRRNAVLLIVLDIFALAFAARVNIFQEFYCKHHFSLFWALGWLVVRYRLCGPRRRFANHECQSMPTFSLSGSLSQPSLSCLPRSSQTMHRTYLYTNSDM